LRKKERKINLIDEEKRRKSERSKDPQRKKYLIDRFGV
jgi:hypothetical protein